MAATGARALLGRTSERDALDRLLDGARGGRSGTLVVRGEAGIGKSALLEHAFEQAAGFRIARVAGVEAGMELPFAGVHGLCAPLLDHVDALPAPQRDALRTALGVSPGEPPDPFLVALAVLTLLAAVAEEQPLLCLVEDAQWLDAASARVVGFVARRVLAESVAVVAAVRDPPGQPALDGLPDLALEGLDEGSARALLEGATLGRLDDHVRDRVIDETRGNPLALVELPRHMGAAELAAGFGLATAGDVPARIEQHYLRRVRNLPEAAQRLMLVAAAEPVGDAALIRRAAQTLGIGQGALAPAEDADLLTIGARARFRHPLVRSAVYRDAPADARRHAHAALAEATDPVSDPDRRAWHRALAAAGPDDDVAAELERTAGRAQQRGGLAAAAALLERATALTVDPALRAQRALTAAQAQHQAGDPAAALALLAGARSGSLDRLGRARADLLDAQIAFSTQRDRNAPGLLLAAAKQLEPLDAALARETYLEALMAAQFAGHLAPGADLEIARAARAAPPAPSPRAADLLLDGMAVMVTDGHAAAAPLLRRAIDAFEDGDLANGGFRWLWLAQDAAQEIWDHDTWYALAMLQLRLVRETGALTVLPLAFTAVICSRIYAGELAAGATLLDDQRNAIEATGSRMAPYAELILLAWRGREAELTAMVDATLEDIVPRGEGIGVTTCRWVTTVLHLGLGRFDDALATAERAISATNRLDWPAKATLPEIVEAAARSGRIERARAAFEQLSAVTGPSGTDWGLGLEARARALVSDPADAEPLYREAIERLGRTRLRAEHARAHLLYGEWLHEAGREQDAHEQLLTAHRLFTAMGMEAFAGRARRHLPSSAAAPDAGAAEPRDELTAQERQIARLAREGLSNPEIAARLFLSPRTVEWHLGRVFGKLGIRSRRELPDALPGFGD